MSGCPVGCTFCGTGKKFIRNLKSSEIIEQILTVLNDKGLSQTIHDSKRFQIMFMSMGEPMLNWDNVELSIIELNKMFPKAELLLSTIGINDNNVLGRIVRLSEKISKVGLQFSIHKSNENNRNELIPFMNKLTLRQIGLFGGIWNTHTGRKVYLNYCIDGTNNTQQDFENLVKLFKPIVFNFTFSVVCSPEESMHEVEFRNLDIIHEFSNKFVELGYNTRVFNPEGQDDIGGGCGQLWYVQKWMKENAK
jgi:23S rRNA (adenine2503-C2)-methyltransferase